LLFYKSNSDLDEETESLLKINKKFEDDYSQWDEE
jgi:hypothetical protein